MGNCTEPTQILEATLHCGFVGFVGEEDESCARADAVLIGGFDADAVGRKHAADRHGTLSSSVNVLLRFYELAFVPRYGMIRAQERERKHVEKENCQTRKDRRIAARFD